VAHRQLQVVAGLQQHSNQPELRQIAVVFDYVKYVECRRGSKNKRFLQSVDVHVTQSAASVCCRSYCCILICYVVTAAPCQLL
jgi:hypothetical protein